ncbi:hypothetical protein OEA41_007556 [Lepraria neglecta]|uniref:Uncharacterized protein n=1 Tax=Lepraria neglecta TaxID=209136 RepID=A0AAE0DN21_9LECA|nr:hypothetical protein OEA41_007556 [Lepraria neglecta]
MESYATVTGDSSKLSSQHNPQPQQQRQEGPESDREAVPSDSSALRLNLESCTQVFKGLIDTALDCSKVSVLAGTYFYPIARQIDDELIRLEIWASDLEADDPNSSAPLSDITLQRYIYSTFQNIGSQLEDIGKEIRLMRGILEQVSARTNTDPKSTRQLQKATVQIGGMNKNVDLAVRNLVDITEAFQMEQAVRSQSGGLARLRKHVLSIREQALIAHEPAPIPSVSDDSSIDESIAYVGLDHRIPLPQSSSTPAVTPGQIVDPTIPAELVDTPAVHKLGFYSESSTDLQKLSEERSPQVKPPTLGSSEASGEAGLARDFGAEREGPNLDDSFGTTPWLSEVPVYVEDAGPSNAALGDIVETLSPSVDPPKIARERALSLDSSSKQGEKHPYDAKIPSPNLGNAKDEINAAPKSATLDSTAATFIDSSGLEEDNPWSRKTLLTLGESDLPNKVLRIRILIQ